MDLFRAIVQKSKPRKGAVRLADSDQGPRSSPKRDTPEEANQEGEEDLAFQLRLDLYKAGRVDSENNFMSMMRKWAPKPAGGAAAGKEEGLSPQHCGKVEKLRELTEDMEDEMARKAMEKWYNELHKLAQDEKRKQKGSLVRNFSSPNLRRRALGLDLTAPMKDDKKEAEEEELELEPAPLTHREYTPHDKERQQQQVEDHHRKVKKHRRRHRQRQRKEEACQGEQEEASRERRRHRRRRRNRQPHEQKLVEDSTTNPTRYLPNKEQRLQPQPRKQEDEQRAMVRMRRHRSTSDADP
ncbi:hypothetical protein QOT17_001032 [Balamuthia mandrillaris]